MTREYGQSLVETLALTLTLVIALLVPVGSGRPVAGVLLEAFVAYLRAQAFVISIV